MPETNYCPTHVGLFLRSATPKFKDESDPYHHYFQAICTCGKDRVDPLIGDKDSFGVECVYCHERLLLYDLDNYPAATKLEGAESFTPVEIQNGQARGKIFVMYEYGRPSANETWDRNNITWFEAMLEDDSGNLHIFVNDETA